MSKQSSNDWLYDPPAYLPPRQKSLPDLTRKVSAPRIANSKSTRELKASPPPYLPPRRPTPKSSNVIEKHRHSATSDAENSLTSYQRSSGRTSFGPAGQASPESRPVSSGTITSTVSDTSFSDVTADSRSQSLEVPTSPVRSPRASPRLKAVQDGLPLPAPVARRPPVLRHSSLRIESRVSEEHQDRPVLPPNVLGTSFSESRLDFDALRPHSHPPLKPAVRSKSTNNVASSDQQASRGLINKNEDPWQLPPLPALSQPSPALSPKPRPSLIRLSSLDNLMTYRDERSEWKRASSTLQQRNSTPLVEEHNEMIIAKTAGHESPPITPVNEKPATDIVPASAPVTAPSTPPASLREGKFRHFVAEIGFCFTIAMTQFLAEFLISGFAIELPRLLFNNFAVGPGNMGVFWPATLCMLTLSSTLLIFARLSDLYGGYPFFIFGNVWLAIWTLIPGLTTSLIILDVSRAMQGLAIAAVTPSTFVMVGSIYPEGPRRNIVLGLYGACAPLGFYVGFLTAGALPQTKTTWYFWIASILAWLTAATAYLTVPSDRTNRRALGLKMDWLGAFLITAGLVLVAYALAIEPYVNQFDGARNGWSFPAVLGPLVSGLTCLFAAVWVEGWYASSPLLPFDFFRPRGVKAFCVACLFFYGSFGVWLYNSAILFQSSWATDVIGGLEGITLALWYTPAAVGGIFFCVVGGALLHIIPIKLLLIVSGLAWVAAPLILALCPLPLNYWAHVMPSALCATIGIDLTFTISTAFLSSSQPLRYQGLAGAVCSVLVNLAMSFSLSISEIVQNKAQSMITTEDFADVLDAAEKSSIWGMRATFIYAAASAGVGLLIVVCFVRISRSVVRERPEDIERPRETSSEASTLVDANESRQQEMLERRSNEA